MSALAAEIKRDAHISSCGKYRYWLTREWDSSLLSVAWIMLNPSTADASKDDPTIRRCIGFSKTLGYGSLIVLNLFPYRATNPRELITAERPEGDDDAGLHFETNNRAVIAAWGTRGSLFGRDEYVLSLLRERTILCLGKTKDGHPKHPLYVPADTLPELFRAGDCPQCKTTKEIVGE